jgi:hypothetical protein
MFQRLVIALIFIMFISEHAAQTVFWTETFNNGCTANCTAYTGTNGAWSFANNGSNGPTPNKWFISCAENGMAVGSCGAGCGANATMHISSDPNSDCGCLLCPSGDCGAAYDACSGFNFCFNSPLANKRAISPPISTVGKSGISVSFDYIENGDGANDDGMAYYSTNGGTTWVLLVNTAKTALGCGGQGIWTNYTSAALPAACDNNANFRLSFVWVNNADDVGNDPSYAINDLKVRYTTVLPVELSEFTAEQTGASVLLKWKTESEKNFSYFEVQRSTDASYFSSIGKVNVQESKNSGEKFYSFSDSDPLHSLSYYRLKMVDKDMSYKYSEMAVVDEENPYTVNQGYFLNSNNQIIINENYITNNRLESADIFDMSGKLISRFRISDHINNGTSVLPCSDLMQGIYLCRLNGPENQKSFRFIISK